MNSSDDLARVRWMVAIVIFGLVVSGVTAFPLLGELNWISNLLVGSGGSLESAAHDGMTRWILKVREGLEVTYEAYPFIGYGTDWLAFGHLVIALFFIPAWRDPVRNIAVLRMGITACVLVWPLALIAGEVRGIPIGWRLIDCSFGLLAIVPLMIALKLTSRMEREGGRRETNEPDGSPGSKQLS